MNDQFTKLFIKVLFLLSAILLLTALYMGIVSKNGDGAIICGLIALAIYFTAQSVKGFKLPQKAYRVYPILLILSAIGVIILLFIK
jgi:hypothetical protein